MTTYGRRASLVSAAPSRSDADVALMASWAQATCPSQPIHCTSYFRPALRGDGSYGQTVSDWRASYQRADVEVE
jgi:hypothetical protein